jgi:hypothetical protein
VASKQKAVVKLHSLEATNLTKPVSFATKVRNSVLPRHSSIHLLDIS